MKPVPFTHSCVWQFTHFKVFVCLLKVLEKYSCRILRSIRTYTREYTDVYSEYTGIFHFQPCHQSHQLTPLLQLLMTLPPTNTLYTQKNTICAKHKTTSSIIV